METVPDLRTPVPDPVQEMPPSRGAGTNILLIRLKSIGDILFTLPAVHVVRENFPDAKISFLTSKEYAPLIEGFRDVDEVIPIDRALYHRGNPITIVRETISLLRRLRRAKFALEVDFQGFGETGLLTWFAGAPQRWGTVYQPARRWAYTRGIVRDMQKHPAEHNVSLLQQCGLRCNKIRNEFLLPPASLDEARRYFGELGLDATKPMFFIQPFTSALGKNWPLEKYLALAGHWRNRGVQFLFGGGPAERAALEPVRRAGFPVSAGAPLLVTAGLMNLCALVIGGDTGLLHLAVAMNKRVIMPIAATRSTGPFQHADWALRPLDGPSVSSITLDAVIDACAQALADLGIDIRNL